MYLSTESYRIVICPVVFFFFISVCESQIQERKAGILSNHVQVGDSILNLRDIASKTRGSFSLQ